MKIFLTALSMLLIAAQVCSIPQEMIHDAAQIDQDMIHAVAEECEWLNNVSKDMADKAKSGQEIANDPKMKKHLVCYYTRLGVLESDSTIYKENLEDYLKVQLKGKSEEERKTIVKDCSQVNQVQDDTEETAFKLAKCITKYKKM